MEEHARSLPPKPFRDGTLDYDLDLLIDDLLVAWDTNRWLKRHCKNKTVFRMPDDEPKVREHIVGKYGAQAEIAKERFLV